MERDKLLKANPTSVLLKTENSTLGTVIKFLQKQSFYEENFNNKSHISKHEWQDILNLKKNKDIVIKEADKGGQL